MRILVHDYAGHPFQAELSRALARRGHDVCHAYASSLCGPRGALSARRNDPETLRFTPIDLGERMEKANLFRRRMQERAYGALLTDLVSSERPEVVLSANTPSEAQARLANYCNGAGIRFVSWVQDMYGLAAYRILRRKLPVIGEIVGRYYMSLDRRAARGSAAVVLISDDFRPQMRRWRIPENNIQVIPNWAPLDEVPVRPRENAWSDAHGLNDRFCFLYSGTLAMKHNPELLLQLGLHFRDRPDVRVVIVSEGSGADWLRDAAIRHQLENIMVLPFAPFEQLPDVLGAADVLVSILEPEAGRFSVPSKVLTYLCASRPLLLGVPRLNLAAKTVTAAGAGLVAEPTDPAAFVSAAQELLNNPDMRREMGRQGRRYAEANFQIGLITERFSNVLGPVRKAA